jgi:uncharacterized membrane protein (UPF0127 family)
MGHEKEKKIMRYKIGSTVICSKCYWASSFWERTKGLMFKKSIGPTENIDGMLIDYCNSVHTFFMRFPLDLVFLTKDNRVVKVIKNKRPWLMTWFYFGAVKVLELPSGQANGIKINDQLEVEYV